VKPPDEPDLLRGCGPIATYLNQQFGTDEFSEDSVNRLIKAGHLQVGRLGGRVIASRRRLREYLDRLAGGGEVP
jgi:hypothetical protein